MQLAILESIYIIYMWNFFKTSYSFHNFWELSLMSWDKMPSFFHHQPNTYINKVCPLGNLFAYLLAVWVIMYNIILTSRLKKKHPIISQLNTIIFGTTALIAFIMNLNAFIYLIPVFIYEYCR